MLPIRLAESVAFARAYSHHRRPPAAGLHSLSAQKRGPIQNRMRTRILIDNHLFCVHCCAVYTLSGNGGRPAPVTWNAPFTCTTSEGSSFCTSQHRAHTAPGSLRPSHAEYCLRQCLSLYVPQYSPPRSACQEPFLQSWHSCQKAFDIFSFSPELYYSFFIRPSSSDTNDLQNTNANSLLLLRKHIHYTARNWSVSLRSAAYMYLP